MRRLLIIMALCIACRREHAPRVDSAVANDTRSDSQVVRTDTDRPSEFADEKDSLFYVAWHSSTPLRDLSALHEKYGLPIGHWPDSLLSDSLSKLGDEGPCGPEVTLWVKRLSPLVPRYNLDEVSEFNDTAIVRTWSFPANQNPGAIHGEQLLVSLQQVSTWSRRDSLTPVLAISPDGTLRVEVVGDSVPDELHIACPAFVQSPRSSYEVCAEFTDLTTKAKRRLRYEGVCS